MSRPYQDDSSDTADAPEKEQGCSRPLPVPPRILLRLVWSWSVWSVCQAMDATTALLTI